MYSIVGTISVTDGRDDLNARSYKEDRREQRIKAPGSGTEARTQDRTTVRTFCVFYNNEESRARGDSDGVVAVIRSPRVNPSRESIGWSSWFIFSKFLDIWRPTWGPKPIIHLATLATG